MSRCTASIAGWRVALSPKRKCTTREAVSAGSRIQDAMVVTIRAVGATIRAMAATMTATAASMLPLHPARHGSTTANQMIFVKPNGALHNVTDVKKGRRSNLKFVYDILFAFGIRTPPPID